jgi:hypothetical protein
MTTSGAETGTQLTEIDVAVTAVVADRALHAEVVIEHSIDAGTGTETDAASLGDALAGHTRAVLDQQGRFPVRLQSAPCAPIFRFARA